MSRTADHILSLEDAIRNAADAYYNAEPLMPDEDFDRLVDELRRIDPGNEVLKRVGAPPPEAGHLQKAEHAIPMGSLSNATRNGDKANPSYKEWHAKHGGGRVIVMHKLDGSSIELLYEDGRLKQAITRGDGHVGEDVTRNARRFKGVPEHVPGFSGSVRGEALLLLEDFREHFADASNPRNAANGTVRRSDGTGAEHISFIAYDLISGDRQFATHRERLECIAELGFDAVWFRVLDTSEQVDAVHEEHQNTRDSLPFEIDGLVVRIDEEARFLAMGERHGRPKGAVAYKFRAMGADTELLGVKVTVGHTGQIVPTADLAPVQIGGVTVTSALLNNYGEIERLGLAVGDLVHVVRAGDVIPKVVGVTEEAVSRTPVVPPDSCPSCGSVLTEEGANLFCRNADCTERQYRLLNSWVVKRNILYLGDTLLRKLFTDCRIRRPADLYRLTEEFLSGVSLGSGTVGSNATRIMEQIEASKTCSVPDLLGSVGVTFLGRRQAKKLVDQLAAAGTVDPTEQLEWILNAGVEDLETLEGIGHRKAEAVHASLLELGPRIRELLEAGVRPPSTGEQQPAGALGGKSFCLTGAMSRPRREIEAMIAAAGGVPASRVSKDLDFLVAADPGSGSSKARKAMKYGVQVISEEDLLGMLGQ